MIPAYTLADVLALPQRRAVLPEPSGPVIRVASAIDIIAAIEDAEDGTTILIAKGHYRMPRDCILTSHRVVIRGETGNRDDVVLDGGMEFDDDTPVFKARIGAPALIKLSHARDATIADLTVANSPKYGILFFGDGGIRNLRILNVKFHNIWARGLKGTSARRLDDKLFPAELHAISDTELERSRPCNGEVRDCLFICDHIKRNDQDQFDGDYISGMDLMHVRNWTVHDNVFVGIRGKNGNGRGAVFIWQESVGVRVENNIFFACDRGIALGNPSGKPGKPFHIKDAVVRDNVILGGSDKAIEIDFGVNISIIGNRISSAERKDYASISMVAISGDTRVSGNEIARGPGPIYHLEDNVQPVDDRIV